MGTLAAPCRIVLCILAVAGALADAPARAATTSMASQYLLAREAEHRGDWAAAAKSLASLYRHTGDEGLLREAFLFNLGTGDIPEALALAHDIKPGFPEASLASALSIGEAIHHRDYDAARRLTGEMPMRGVDMPLAALLNGWLLAARNHADDRQAAYDQLEGAQALEAVRKLHVGLIAEATGDTEQANRSFADIVATKPSPRLAAFARSYYLRHGEKERAAAIHIALPGADNLPPMAAPGIAGGAAEAYYDIAELLLEADHPDVALFYAQVGRYLDPSARDIHFLLGEIAEAQGRHAQAAADFTAVPKSSVLTGLAGFDAALAYERGGNAVAAVAAATRVATALPHNGEAQLELGDMLRRNDRFADAAKVYTAALAEKDLPPLTRADLFFSRGVCLDQMARAVDAESDLKQAAALHPDQPLFMNYLGYFWANRGQNLAGARDMLVKARKLAPNDPAIADSLGWALFALGDYIEAVPHLENAVQLNPGDSVVNGHLGDAYWQVGRHREARFQWRQALLNAASRDADALRAKLREGIRPSPLALGENHAEMEGPMAR